MRSLALVFVAIVAIGAARAQNPTGFTVTQTDPTANPCGSNSVILRTPLGNIYTCVNGAYALTATGAGGAAACPGGDLGGTPPNCTVTNGSNITNSSVKNSALVNPPPAGTGAVVVNSGSPSLASGTASNCVLVNGTSAPCDAPGQGAVANVTPITVSANVTSPQVLQQLSLTAGLLNVAGNSGGVYTYNGSGIYTAAALQTPTLTWTLNLCTVSGCGSGTVRALATIVTPAVVTATNNAWNIRLHIGNTATGATGTLITHGSAIVELTAASDLGTASSDSNTASSGTIDLTAPLFLQLTVTTSTGNAGNSVTEDHSSLEPASAIGPTGATGPAGIVSVITYGFPAFNPSSLNGVTGYDTFGKSTGMAVSEALAATPFAAAGTVSGLSVIIPNGALTVGVNVTVALRKNGSTTALTCTVTGTASLSAACTDMVDSVTVSVGDKLNLIVTISLGSAPSLSSAGLFLSMGWS